LALSDRRGLVARRSEPRHASSCRFGAEGGGRSSAQAASTDAATAITSNAPAQRSLRPRLAGWPAARCQQWPRFRRGRRVAQAAAVL